jgi:RNA polymerase sigma factor (sigma-70 family)
MKKSKTEHTDAKADLDLLRLQTLHSEQGVFELLYRDFYPRLYEFIVRILGNPDGVEETINDTMLVVWNKSHEFRGCSKVSTWIFGIAYKKALKRLKADKRKAEKEIQRDVEQEDTRDPADVVSHKRTVERVRTAVGDLPAAQRSVVHLAFFYGYSYSEIAQIVGCPVNTVKTRMFYARERLRPVLDRAMNKEYADEDR